SSSGHVATTGVPDADRCSGGVTARYSHTNLVARNWKRLLAFYQDVLGCISIGETRDLRGEWLERLTGIEKVHVVGEHLCLPGYGDAGPTLEIFSYEPQGAIYHLMPNAAGFAHIAFLVDDMHAVLQRLLAAGGSQVGDLIRQPYADGRVLTAVYARDPEGNIIEIQNWSRVSDSG
ncbi:MAG TPA: VOC family protein, partial [Thermomicrobiales bacterium]|nr:VOC family protein [Thermomicrobiales bacterium]